MKRRTELMKHSQMHEETSLHGRQPARSSGSSEASQPSSWTPTRGKKNTSVLPLATAAEHTGKEARGAVVNGPLPAGSRLAVEDLRGTEGKGFVLNKFRRCEMFTRTFHFITLGLIKRNRLHHS